MSHSQSDFFQELSPEDQAVAVKLLGEFVFVVPLGLFVYRKKGRWEITTPVPMQSMAERLERESKWPPAKVKQFLKASLYTKVDGIDLVPKGEPIVSDTDGSPLINIWVKPTLVAKQGAYPCLDRVLNHLTNNDPGARNWLVHWIAQKVQNPGLLPKIGPLFVTPEGAGKGVLFRAVSEQLGPDNCVEIRRDELESRFNTRWVGAVLVFCNEVTTRETAKDVSSDLKMLLDSPTIKIEGKGQHALTIKNRMAWMFASNESMSLVINEGDRRYSVFENMTPVPPDCEYRMMMDDCFERFDKCTATPAFQAELQAFYFDMLALKVDFRLVARPYQNAARDAVIHANLSSAQQYFARLEESGIDELVDAVGRYGNMELVRGEWDLGEHGVSMRMIHACYLEFCRQGGVRAPVRENVLGREISAKRPTWVKSRPTSAKGVRVYCYTVPRGPARTKTLKIVP